MNINDYKDGNGNVEVSETLVGDLIDGINGVVESGSNSNGNWVKFADGTMICTKIVTVDNVAIETTWGSLYRSETTPLGELPLSFIVPPVISYNFYQHTGNLAWLMSGTITTPSTSSAGFYTLVRPTTATGLSGTIEVTAIGRWK